VVAELVALAIVAGFIALAVIGHVSLLRGLLFRRDDN